MFRIEHAGYLYFLLLIPLFVLIYLLARQVRLRSLKKLGELNLLSRLFPDASRYKPLVKFVILMSALSFLIVAIANPQTGSRVIEAKREGVDVVVLLDVSNSMKAEDVKPNRLERAKQAVSRLIDKLQNDRIAIIVFAGEAFVQLPLTTDYAAAKLFLSTVDTDIMPTQGTAIGRAIDLALNSFKIENGRRKAMIIITDGENHEDDAIDAAKRARDKGFVIHTIGMGSINGGPIPLYSNGQNTGFLQDKDGNVVVTKLDADMLRQIATSGNGRFIRSSQSDPDLAGLVDDIGKMNKKEYGSKLFTDYEDRFQYFIGAALLLLIAEVFLSDRKNRMITSLNKFVERYR